ncbi:glycosyltransferase involved in cell wall biosynthesis [Pelomonas aquatica]|uniref:Glycosyltransferase involved in cell wall biosynthesis n=1 Tax=Pelomonas aquatica TaxID=431058 RepID=A0ABU1Z536_9BURK|nr:glycosyltransferase family 4 protein [Pelomonas aquatica]MDR7295728.1 glycosyltransferase involved in cell wall biosynthesis [Pelomonas aquatica]
MKHALFVLSGFGFPPREGLHVQSAELMRRLATRGWTVSCVLRIQRGAHFDAEAFARAIGTNGVIVPIRSRLNYPLELLCASWVALTGWPSRYLAAIRGVERERPVDVLHVEGIPMMPLVASLPRLPVVVSEVDAWSLRQTRLRERAVGAPKRLFLAGYAAVSRRVERWILPLAKVSHVVSGADAQYLRALVPHADVRCIPVAVAAPARTPMQRLDLVPPRQPLNIIFWGDIGVPHLRGGLVWLISEVLPALTREGVKAQLRVLGRRDPDAELRKLADGVEFLTWIDDVSALLSSCDVVALPDQSGTGLKNRVLEAMALGVPVVGTSHAFEGIPVSDGQEAYTRDTVAGFTSALIEIARTADLQRMGRAAAEFVRRTYSFDAIVDQWEDVYATAQQRMTAPR